MCVKLVTHWYALPWCNARLYYKVAQSLTQIGTKSMEHHSSCLSHVIMSGLLY